MTIPLSLAVAQIHGDWSLHHASFPKDVGHSFGTEAPENVSPKPAGWTRLGVGLGLDSASSRLPRGKESSLEY